MRKALFLVLGLPVSVVVVLALWVVLRNARDEVLEPAAATALANPHADVAPADNLYFELIAFDVRDAAAPAEVGRAMVGRYRAARRGSYDWNLDPAVARTPFAGDRLGLCSPDPSRSPCLARAAAHPRELQDLVDANRRLLERYRRVASYHRLEYPVPLTPDSPLPAWQSFMAGKHLLMSEIALGAVAGRADAAALRLRDDALFTRRLLAAQDITLIDKMVLAVAFRQDLQLAAELLRAATLSHVALQAIAALAAPMTDAERSLAGPYGREFEIAAAAFAPLAQPANADRFMSASGADRRWAGLGGRFTRYLYQPNATLNLAWRQTLSMRAAAGMPCERQVHGGPAPAPSPGASVLEATYNPIGQGLLANRPFDYAVYPHRLCELAKLQRLVALHVAIRDQGIPDASVAAFVAAGGEAYRDPLTGRPFRFDPARRAFDVQFEDRGFAGLGPWAL